MKQAKAYYYSLQARWTYDADLNENYQEYATSPDRLELVSLAARNFPNNMKTRIVKLVATSDDRYLSPEDATQFVD